jgi:hypothetical protein
MKTSMQKGFLEVLGVHNMQVDFNGSEDNNFQNVTYTMTSNVFAFVVASGRKLPSNWSFVIEFYGRVRRTIVTGNKAISEGFFLG